MTDELTLKTFGALEVKDAEKGEVTAIVATLNAVDKDGDVILPGALPEGGAKVKMSGYAHDVVLKNAPPVGKGTITEEGDKLVFRGNFYMTTDRGRQAFLQAKEEGPDSEWSFGFPPRTVKSAELTKDWKLKGARRMIAGFLPREASPVFIGAGVDTGTVSVKAASDEPPSDPPPVAKPTDEDIQTFQANQTAWLKS
jgi:hypothetical protein